MGLAGGAISVFSASRFLQIGAILLLILPITLSFFAEGGIKPIAMASAGIVFLLSAMRSSKVLSDAIEQNFSLKHELLQANTDAERLARVDELTQLFNRRAFYEHYEMQWAQAKRSGNDLSLIMLDIDNFKRVNDSFGHDVGDLALQHTANLLRESIRSSDICGRLGGEEFGLLLPNTKLEQAESVAENLRSKLDSTHFEYPGGTAPLTASFGVTDASGGIPNFIDMVKRADSALYSAKAAGRNQVKVASKEESITRAVET